MVLVVVVVIQALLILFVELHLVGNILGVDCATIVVVLNGPMKVGSILAREVLVILLHGLVVFVMVMMISSLECWLALARKVSFGAAHVGIRTWRIFRLYKKATALAHHRGGVLTCCQLHGFRSLASSISIILIVSIVAVVVLVSLRLAIRQAWRMRGGKECMPVIEGRRLRGGDRRCKLAREWRRLSVVVGGSRCFVLRDSGQWEHGRSLRVSALGVIIWFGTRDWCVVGLAARCRRGRQQSSGCWRHVRDLRGDSGRWLRERRIDNR